MQRCLDWLEEHARAAGYFKKALDLDPNGYYVAAHYGWHYFQVGDYTTARKWFQRSADLYSSNNPIAFAYLKILNETIPGNPRS